MEKFVLYVRVSTKRQGKTGNGLEAQKRDIQLFLDNYAEEPFEVLAEYQDIESGRSDDRTELQKAIALCKKEKATLLVSKLDRLSRKVSYLASLMEDKKLNFRVASMPNADKFQLHIYAALAEQERSFIASRTRSALKSWKERNPDKKLGAPRHHIEKLATARKAKARQDADKVSGVILPLRKQGASLKVICDTLNGSGITTSRGTSFHPSLVSRMLSTLEVAV